MAKYKISGDGIKDTETGAYIPNAGGNRHWQEYLEWVADGNVPDDEFTEQELIDRAWVDLRSKRDLLLKQTDFMMTYDFYYNVMSAQEKTDLTAYRAALRDLPSNTIDPSNPVWPTQPQVVINNLS
jgi:hypothetical protein